MIGEIGACTVCYGETRRASEESVSLKVFNFVEFLSDTVSVR